MGWRLKVALIVIAAGGALLLLIVTFVVGLAVGFGVERSGAQSRCESSQGAWNEELRVCQLQVAAEEPVQDEVAIASGTDAYRCEDGILLAVTATDPEQVQVRASSTELTLTLVRADEEGQRYEAEGAALLIATGSASWTPEGEEATRCLREGQ